MSARTLMICALLLSLSVSSAALAGFDKHELEVPGSVLWVSFGDLDSNGLTDIVVSYARGAGPTSSRYVAVFFREDKGYKPRPDVAFVAPKNAAIFDVGDALGDAQDELVYLTPFGVYAQPFRDRRPGNPTKIVSAPTLIGEPEEGDFVSWDFLRVLPGEKEPTLIIPGRSELLLYRRKDGSSAWKRWSAVGLERYNYYDAETSTYRPSGRGGGTGRPYAFRVTTIVPNLSFVDQTGDGLVDLVTHYDDRVSVYPRLEDGTLSEKPSYRRWFKVLSPSELQTRDYGVSAEVQDIDQDGVADLIFTKIGGGITTLATEIRLHRGRKGGGFSDQPDQSFENKGFGALVSFVDVDGDGRLEMLQPYSEVSIVAISKMLLSSELGLEVKIRRKAKPPELFERQAVQSLETTFGLDLSVGATLRGAAPTFGHDFDGDGIRDVLLSQGGDKLVLNRGKKGEERLFEEEGHVTLSAAVSNTTLVLHPRVKDQRKPDVLVYYVARRNMASKLVLFQNRY